MLDLQPTTRPCTVFDNAAPWTLIHGEALAVLRDLPDASVDALITDPPYSSGGMMRGDRMTTPANKYSPRHQGYHTFSGDNRDAHSWAFWCALWLNECTRIVRPGGYLLMFTDWRQLPMASDVFQIANGAIWRGLIAWDKGPTARAPHTGYVRHQCEYIVWGSIGTLEDADGRGPFPGAYTIPTDPTEKEHMTGKPVALMSQLARMVPPGGLILDPFAGSGSTGAGALLEGRRFLGIEREEPYVEIARARLTRAAAVSTAIRTGPIPSPRTLALVVSPDLKTAPAWRWRSPEPRGNL